MNVPKNLLYSAEHEWVSAEGGKAIIGITDHAQHTLGDIVFVELPGVGDELLKGQTFGVVESVKAVSDVFAPLAGTVTEINTMLLDKPELLNADAYANWMIVVDIKDEAELNALLNGQAYTDLIEQES